MGTGDFDADEIVGFGGIEFLPAQQRGAGAGFGEAAHDGEHERRADARPGFLQKSPLKVDRAPVELAAAAAMTGSVKGRS